MRTVLGYALKSLSELFHLSIEKGWRRRDVIRHGRFVSTRGEVIQCIECPRSLIIVQFSIREVFERGVTLNFESFGHLRFFGGVDFGYDDAILRIIFLKQLVELFPLANMG